MSVVYCCALLRDVTAVVFNHALARLCMQSAILLWQICLSVCLSVRHTLVLYRNECIFRQTLSTVW